MDEYVALRCKYCGAPLDENEVRGEGQMVTCSSCGTTQQKLDARAYMDQLMGQVRSWINQAMPGGMTVSQTQNVDSVARHNIFMTNFKPKIEVEFTSFKFGLNSLIAQNLMVMPFAVNGKIAAAHTPAQAFEFGAKIKEISPLAVSEESNRIVTEISRVTDAYAVLINNCKLIREDRPGRFLLMAGNFSIASQDFSQVPGYGPAQARFEGLSMMCQGCEKLMNGDRASARMLFEQSRNRLTQAASDSLANIKVAVMGQSVNQELKQADALIELTEYVDAMGGSKEVFDGIRRIFTYEYPAQGNWAFLLNNHDRLSEIFVFMSNCVKAKTGTGTIRTCAGGGDILIPFWDIDLKYSFQTGSLWKKHSVEVDEELLISADFAIDEVCLCNPRKAVTDVFAARGSNGIVAGLTGNETSISSSQGIDRLLASASENTLGGRDVVVPLSTRREAERIAENYVQQVARTESKLKLSNPEVRGLIFIPFSRKDGHLIPPAEFGSLLPDRLKTLNLDRLIIL